VPRWSPDGTRLAYLYWPSGGEGNPIVVADARTGTEQPITSLVPTAAPFDWSNDGQWVLASLKRSAVDPVGVWTLPVAAAPGAEKDARPIASDAHHELWQPRFSPDDRWVVFMAVSQPDQSRSTLHLVPASGGSWTQITEGRYWDDTPRWSPDGRSIYFTSSRDGVFNVWAVAFDSERGQVEGDPVGVTAFDGPRRRMLPIPSINDIAVSGDRLFVCLEEDSGSIWILDKVDR
jgi:Tol biopolymer transport system component